MLTLKRTLLRHHTCHLAYKGFKYSKYSDLILICQFSLFQKWNASFGVPEEFLKGEKFIFLSEKGLFCLFGVLVNLFGVILLLTDTGVLSLLGDFQTAGNVLFLFNDFET